MYKKPVKTGKPNPITAVRPGSVDDLMTKYNQQFRTAKKEKQTTTMLFEAVIQIKDNDELDQFADFIEKLNTRRNDPFRLKSLVEVREQTAAAMKFDELVPADDPPEATAGPTWAPHPAVEYMLEAFPTEDDAVAAFKRFAATHKAEESVELVKSFNVARVKELKPEQRASFIAEASRGT